MAYPDRAADGTYHIRLTSRSPDTGAAINSIGALRDYLEQCDDRRIAPDTDLFLSAEDRLTRDDIFSALPLCINIIRIGTTLVLPDGARFDRADMNANLAVHLVLALATLDLMSQQ